ncbi:extracellular solute-binding protein [uncultured Alsobacter sp.]|uniref:extracellular solute-binding protein n=1 Tax=uncultured Alsobacter sp. TaxID=1748258 RepID=UPI0025F1A1C4|nr:extracellular solute-binding protein [uncultured Alsobacter sp.]
MKAVFVAGLLLAAAATGAVAQDKRVVVYTAHNSNIIELLQPRFEKETGIKVDLVKAGSGDIIKRVRAEAGSPKADVIWSIGGESLEDNKDLLASYAPKDAAVLNKAYTVSPEWLPYTGIMAVFAVNTKQLKPADYPKSWKDLADPKWKGKISSARADSSGSSFQQLGTVLTAYGDKGWDTYKGILANFALSDSSGAVVRFVNDGEALVGLTLEDNALEYVRNGGNVAIVYPEDGTSTVADGIAMVKGGPNVENGKAFVDWLLSKPVQEILVKEIGRRSVRTDVNAAGLKPMNEIKLVNYDIKAAAANRNAWIATWKKALADR